MTTPISNQPRAENLTSYDIQTTNSNESGSIYSGKAEKTVLTLLGKLSNDPRNSADKNDELLSLAKLAVLLIPPNMDFETALLVVDNLLQKLGDTQVSDARRSLTTKEKRVTALQAERMKKIEERIEKIRSQGEASKKQQTSADIGLGFSTAATALGILSFFATIFTGGLALPFLVAAAVGTFIGAMTTSMDVANRIVQGDPKATETDPFGNKRQKEISFGRVFRLVDEAIDAQRLKDAGKDITKLSQDEKDSFTKKWNKTESDGNTAMTVILMAATIACCLPSIISGIKDIIKNGLSAVLKGTSSTSEITQNTVEASKKVLDIKKSAALAVAEATEAAASVGSSISDISSGAYGLQLADISLAIKTTDNEKTFYDAMSRFEQNNADYLLNFIEKVTDRLEQFIASTSESVSTINQLKKSLVRNFN
jgi:hypothetical protein